MVTDYIHKTVPYEHQEEAFLISRDLENFALLMEQGTGKTKVALDTAAWLYAKGDIDAVVVIAPNGVHRNWVVNEIPIHLPDYIPRVAAFHRSSATVKEKKLIEQLWDPKFHGLRIYAVNVEAFSRKESAVKKEVRKFLNAFRCLMIVDESSKIKTVGATRTRSITALGKHAAFRRILNGTLISQSPMDAFAQFGFLSRDLLGFTTIAEFRAQFAVTEPRVARVKTPGGGERKVKYDEIIGYKNLADLKQLIIPHSFRVRKKDCLDLPEKVYVRRIVELSTEQKRLYAQMLEESVAQLRLDDPGSNPPRNLPAVQQLLWFLNTENTVTVTAANAAVKLMRLQQILGGFLPDKNGAPIPIGATNPRIDAVVDVVNETQDKIIIWSRFRAEIEAIHKTLDKEFGEGSAVMYYGGVKQKQRDIWVDEFQNNPAGPRFFVAQQQSAGFGLTLTAANTVIYFSNDFSLESRLQSEDRAHRIGQEKKVTYIDLEAADTVDGYIVESLRNKLDIAKQVVD